jgi:hypothetical protein
METLVSNEVVTLQEVSEVSNGGDIDVSKEFDLKDIELVAPSHNDRVAGSISIVSNKNSHRVTFSKDLMNQLGNPTGIQVAFKDNDLVISNNLASNQPKFSLKGKDSNIVYGVTIVNSIIEHWGLDFDNRTSITLGTHEVIHLEDTAVAVIRK